MGYCVAFACFYPIAALGLYPAITNVIDFFAQIYGGVAMIAVMGANLIVPALGGCIVHN